MGEGRARVRAKTSIEIMRERDALEQRLRELEQALDAVEAETEQALHHPEHPEIGVLALCRVAALVRRTRGGAVVAPPESGVHRRGE